MRKISCENSIERIWGLFLYFENEPIAKKFLLESYLTLVEEKEANRLAFDNTQKFIYFLKQGVSYFKSAQSSELIVRPLLLYYGFTSLMKAMILSKDPYYPRTTTVLQHGITTRKRKKSNYVFHEDEIKVQKNGLLPHFAEVVLQSPLEIHSKYKMIDLISMLPELQDSYELMFGEKTMHPIFFSKDKNESRLNFNKSNHLVERLSSLLSELDLDQSMYNLEESHQLISIVIPEHTNNKHPLLNQIVSDYKGNSYFYLLQKTVLKDEIIIYNMIMYILGMLCRYDTELWGDLLFTFSSSDMYLIEELLQLSMRKFPNLVLNHLFNEEIIFET